MKQPWVWVGWLFSILVILSVTRNPLYLVLILLCLLFVGVSLRRVGAELPGPFSVWKLAVWIIGLATLFNALTSHYGETLLVTIPGRIPLISGNVTVEAMLYGATNGLILTGMLAGFTVLNLALPARELIGLIPRAFFPLAVVTSIAITYLPTTLRQFRHIREAQAVRGHQMRTLRDWLPLLMPLLVGGLEHAMQLAEAMTARGFASTKTVEVSRKSMPRFLMLVGLILLVTGWVIQLDGYGKSGLGVIIAGSLMVLSGLWLIGRQSPRTSYHRIPWSWKDLLTLLVALLVVAVCFIPSGITDNLTLYYDPYPLLSVPPFSPVLGLVIMGLVLPGLLVYENEQNHDTLIKDGLKEGA